MLITDDAFPPTGPDPMTCDDYRALWNRRLDDPASFEDSSLARIAAHDDACPPCRQLGASFRIMLRPLTPPAVPEGLADRILASWDRDTPDVVPSRRPAARVVAIAIGLAAAALLGVWLVPRPVPARREGRPTIVVVVPRAVRPWASSLADATSATLDLAREASAPAARVGQEVFIASGRAEVSWPVAIEPPKPPSGMLESVSKSVNSGVKPLSDSARRAFSFLAPASRPPRPPRSDS